MALKFVQTLTLYLAGSGVAIGATSASLTSLTDIYQNVLTMTDFGSKGYVTFEPDTTNEEAATFTGITANANGTYTLTGVSTMIAKSPYTETSGLVRQHAGGSKIVITDNVGFWATFGNKNNTGTWSAIQTFATGATPVITDAPVNPTDAANKAYIDGIAIAGAPDASTTVKGISKLSVAPSSATDPIAVGTNDPRMTPASGTSGGILGYTGTTTIASSVALTANALVLGGGAGATPTPMASLGTTTTVLHGNAAGAPTFGAVSLTADVSGVLPIANGGSGSSTLFTKIAVSAATTTITASGESTVATGTVPANALGTANAVRVRAYVKLTGNAAETTIFKCKYGSTTLITGATITPSGINYSGFVEFTLFANASTAVQYGSYVQVIDAIDSQASTEVNNMHQVGAGTAAEDSTGALAVSITVTFSSTNSTLVVYGSTVEVIK